MSAFVEALGIVAYAICMIVGGSVMGAALIIAFTTWFEKWLKDAPYRRLAKAAKKRRAES